ncbi:hypothetical protein NA56DRAFT_651452 [Hyaloscypha hepaticicola]|uniref:Uncharacterized protein n=1 Tax=Hyaloscypha hepaticicola TaxID=2082293 RepID=A0A2J6PIE8_9HELO|nr:hypothetical protein NA56DRAFT_651452 [Hyaloscypha hepaticicola]
MTPRPPTEQQRAAVNASLDELLNAITAHPEWRAPPNPQPTLFYLWDFVNRSKYMLSEYETIKDGRAVEKPQNFTGSVGKGEKAAVSVFSKVCSRTFMVDMMVNDTSGKTAMITGGPRIDFGKRIKDAVKALQDACPEEHVMAGMMG